MKKIFAALLLGTIFLPAVTQAAIYFDARKIKRIEVVSHPNFDGLLIQFEGNVQTLGECSDPVTTDTVYLPSTSSQFDSILSLALAAIAMDLNVRAVSGGCAATSPQASGTVIQPTRVSIFGLTLVD